MTTPVIPQPPTEPIPVLESAPLWRHTFVSLIVRNYRLFAIANLIGTTAFWVQRVSQDWLVLAITDSVSAVGVTAALQFGPLLVLGLVGGSIIDRFPRKILLQIGQTVGAITSAVLAVLTLSGSAQVWHVYAAAGTLGVVSVVDWPSRSVFANDLVEPKRLANALSLNSSTFQLAGFLGPVIGGALLTTVGTGWTFALNAGISVVAVAVLSAVRSKELRSRPRRGAGDGGIVAGLSYVGSKPAILWPIVMLGAIALFAQNMPVVIAGFVNARFESGAGGYSLFNATIALGAFAAAVLSTRRRSVSLRRVVVCVVIYTSIFAVVGWAPTPLLFSVGLVAVGFSWLTLVTSANYLVQMSANPAVRGRVMSVYSLVSFGGQAVGGLILGWAIDRFGPSVAMMCGGVIVLTVALCIAVISLRRRVPR